jgi:pimeloyl-ACP methyl ester carboxylesterase
MIWGTCFDDPKPKEDNAMPYADNKGIHIYYETEGEGPPLVFQHWSVATLENWADFGYVSALKKDFQLILLDARGHGGSDKPHAPEAYALKNRVEDIVAVLDDLRIAKAHYFGYSMGGWIGFGAALYAPGRFRSLILGGATPFAQKMDGLRQFIQVAIDNGPEAFVAEWEIENGRLSPEARKRMLAYDYEVLLTLAQDRESLEAVLPTMKMPCLLFAGDIDDYEPVGKCASQIVNATFFTLPGLDHGGAIKQSEQVLPHIKDFLAKVEGKDGAV